MVMTQLCTDNLSPGDMELIKLLEGSLSMRKTGLVFLSDFPSNLREVVNQGRF